MIGAISRSPTEEVATFHPLAEHLARRLGEFGIDAGKVVVASSIPELGALMKEGRADLMFDSPYPTLAVSELAGSRVLLRRWKSGKSSYRALIVVRADSPINSLKDLRGRLIAFETGYSTSGYFLPAAALQRAGITLREVAEPQVPLQPEEVGYVFTDHYANSLAWLLRRRADAAGVGEHDYQRFLQRETAQLRVLLQTPSVPRNLVSVRGDLAPALVARVRELLLELERSPEGRTLLQSLEGTTRFDELPAEDGQTLQSMRRLVKQRVHAALR